MNMMTPAQTTAQTSDLQLHVIERYLRDPSIDVAKLDQMVALQERMMRWQTETAWNTAMAEAQAQMQRVAPDANNPQTRSRYATYAAIDGSLRPIYSALGFALSFNTEDGRDGFLKVICDVSRGGHTRRYQIEMPADGKGARGNDVMTKTHATGSAITYGMRYLLKMIFNVATGDADDDGNAAGRGPAVTRAPTARARIAAAAQSDDPQAAAERMHDEWSDKAANGLRNAMVANKPVEHDADGVIVEGKPNEGKPNDTVWDETGERPATPEDEDEDEEPPGGQFNKATYIDSCRDRIRRATDAKALHAWWSSDESKHARRDFALDDTELSTLMAFCANKIRQLKDDSIPF